MGTTAAGEAREAANPAGTQGGYAAYRHRLARSLSAALLLASPPSFAEAREPGASPLYGTGPSEVRKPPASVGLELAPVFAFSEVCERDFDTVGCTTGRGFLALQVLARFPLNTSLTLGPFVALGTELSDRAVVSSTPDGGTESMPLRARFGSAGGELRWYSSKKYSWWFGSRLGLFVVSDEQAVDSGGGLDKSVSYFWGPSLGGALGYDLAAAETIRVTFALRADYVLFPNFEPFPEDDGITWSPGPWLMLGVGMLFGV